MRRRLVVSTIAIVLVVLAVLAAPVALTVHRSAEDELRTRTDERAGALADRFGQTVVEDPVDGGGALVSAIEPNEQVRVVASDGSELVPWRPAAPTRAIVVSRSLPDGARLELAASTAELDDRFRSQMLTLLALAGGALIGAAALAFIQARQLARPLEQLATSAGQLGEGDFSVPSVPNTSIGEIDAISAALRRSAHEIDDMLAAERHFTADARHQLRTGLTGLSMRFELLARSDDPDVVAEAAAGLAQCDQLERTIEELLAVTRQRNQQGRASFDLVSLARSHQDEWRRWAEPPRRPIELEHAPTVVVRGTKGLAGQVLDILVQNSLRHGAGTIRVTISTAAGSGEVLVTDEGPGFDVVHAEEVFRSRPDPTSEHGRGLVLARRLARADGGSLEIVGLRPAQVRYRLPIARDHVMV